MFINPFLVNLHISAEVFPRNSLIFRLIFALCALNLYFLLVFLAVKSSDTVIRGESSRQKYVPSLQNDQTHKQKRKNRGKHKRSASKALHEQQTAVVQLQSGEII